MEHLAAALDSTAGVIGAFVIFFIMIMLGLMFGNRLGMQRIARDPNANSDGFVAFEGAVFGLMGLLIAFTFSGSVGRFDARRDLITREANAIGVAYLRLEMLQPAAQANLKRETREYAGDRLAIYQRLPDFVASQEAHDAAEALQLHIWKDAIAATSTSRSPAIPSLVLPAINKMIDILTERDVALITHPPLAVFALLALSVLGSAVLAGYGMGVKNSKSWPHIIMFAALTATSLYVIFDVEFPRFGLIRIDAADKILQHALDSMH